MEVKKMAGLKKANTVNEASKVIDQIEMENMRGLNLDDEIAEDGYVHDIPLLAGYTDKDGVRHTTFSFREMNGKDEEAINNVIEDIYPDVTFIKYLNYTIAFNKTFSDIEMTFSALTSDIGYEINVHQGFSFTPLTKGIELSKYFNYYKTNITKHGYTNIVDMVVNANNNDQEILMIIKNNTLDKIQKLPHMIDLIESFCNNNLNVSLTSKLLYMHRNTVLNKLDQIEKLTGLNIQKFKDAYAMKILLDLKA